MKSPDSHACIPQRRQAIVAINLDFSAIKIPPPPAFSNVFSWMDPYSFTKKSLRPL